MPDLPTSRDGRFQVLSSDWDSNGCFHVTILDTQVSSTDALFPPDVISAERRTVRNLARRVDPMDKIQWVRIDATEIKPTPNGERLIYRVTASRLDPSHH